MSKKKKLPRIKCPSCKKFITRDDGIKYYQEGTMYYDVNFSKDGSPNYEEDTFESCEGGNFYHDCGGKLDLDYKDIVKLGINY